MRGRARRRARAVAAVLAAAAALALPPRWAGAQERPERVYLNLDRSRIFFSPGNNTVFEGQIAPQLVVAQRFHALLESDGVYGDGEWHRGWSVSASPAVRLRMSRSRSQPILPPSFMPHLVVQRFWLRATADAAGLTGPAAELARREGPVTVWSAALRLSHHSNGQDGCLYATQTLTPVGAGGEAECVFDPGAGPDPATVNFEDGSFSTNFVRLSLFRHRFAPRGSDGDVLGRGWFVGAGVELHAGPGLDRLPGAIPPDQEALHGTWRWRVGAGHARWRARGFWAGGTRLEASVEHAPDVRDDVPAWLLQVEASHLFDRFGGWGLYARLQHGRDDYNLAFVREETFVHLGLAWAQDRFPVGRVTGG